MKTCTRCGVEKSLDEFSAKGARLQSMCKSCNRKYQQDHYQANKQTYLDGNKRRQEEALLWLRTYKEESGCVDCGGKYPHYVLDLDHVRGKTFDFGREAKYKGLATLQAEVALCDVLCANCHRIRTWEAPCRGHSPHECPGH